MKKKFAARPDAVLRAPQIMVYMPAGGKRPTRRLVGTLETKDLFYSSFICDMRCAARIEDELERARQGASGIRAGR